MDELESPAGQSCCRHAWHLYVLRLNLAHSSKSTGRSLSVGLSKKGSAPASISFRFPCSATFRGCPWRNMQCRAPGHLFPQDCLIASLSGDDGGAGSLRGAQCPRDRGGFETGEVHGARNSGCPARQRAGGGRLTGERDYEKSELRYLAGTREPLGCHRVVVDCGIPASIRLCGAAWASSRS